eukprot:2700752-Ditylum_brightwellii.AAC.1
MKRVKQLEQDFETRTNDLAPLVLRKSKHGYAWSLQLVRAGKMVRYWKTHRSSVNNKTDYVHMFHLAKLLEIEDDPGLTLPEIDKHLTAARKALKKAQTNSAKLRDTHLEELANKQLKDGKGNLESVIKNIKHCKEMKLAFKQMKPITKGILGGVVNTLLVPNPVALSSPAIYNNVVDSLKF